MRDSALKLSSSIEDTAASSSVGNELMRDSALKHYSDIHPHSEIGVGNELMRDSALKHYSDIHPHSEIGVGNELMRDSALKPFLSMIRPLLFGLLEMSSCATAL